jgi:aryl-alcohol dehydrogenase-like predicted oxidoreductase
MNEQERPAAATDRRGFLQAGAAATAAALGMARDLPAQEAAAPKAAPVPIPRRKLGRTGVEVTILEQGAIKAEGTDRVLRLAFAAGVRVFDTAKVYQTEPNFKRWFERSPEVRKQIFLVTKDMPTAPKQLLAMLDQRLKALGTDYIDLFFVHGLGDDQRFDAVEFVKGKEFKETAETIRKSGKAKFVGFSTHHKNRAAIIQAAAEAGTVDAIMLQYSPWLARDSALNRALDVCWKNGVGLISMKQVAGKSIFGDRTNGDVLEDVKRRVPAVAERKLSPHQGLLHAIWTDERISAACVSMKNSDQIRENADAARRFEPLKEADIQGLRDAVIASGPTLCADCDGRCAAAAGTTPERGALTRFLTYHQHPGDRDGARRQYAALSPEARDWSGADLDAARAACPSRLDFARLLPDVERYLA